MEPSEVRERILADHQVLRGQLDHLEKRVQEVSWGTSPLLGTLRCDTERLLARLEEHMKWEDRYLAPALRQADAWGEERARRLEKDHLEQRELLHYMVTRLHDQSRPAVMVARDVASLVEMLRRDMEEEEADLLDPRVLRDDVIGIEVETG